VFYYQRDYSRKDEGFLSTVYYVEYEITGKGYMEEKNKSDIIYLKKMSVEYSGYDPKSDDPMNEYDF
jgi:hypothetical protein